MEEPNAKLNNEEVAEEAKEIEKEVKYKIITLQDEEEKGNTDPFIDQVIKELERISEEFKKWCRENDDPEKRAEVKAKIQLEIDRLISFSKEKVDSLKENEDLMHKLETGKETVKKTAETVISAIDTSVQDILNNPAVASTIDTVSDKIVEVIQDEHVQDGIDKVRRSTLKVAESALEGLKKVLKADELKEKDEAKAAQCCLETSEKADEEEQG